MTHFKDELESSRPLPRIWGLLAAVAVSPVYFILDSFGYTDRAYLSVIFLLSLIGATLVSYNMWKDKYYCPTIILLLSLHIIIVILFKWKFPDIGPIILYFLPIAIVDLYVNVYLIKIIVRISR